MKLRKITTIVDEITCEGGRPVEPAARTAVVTAIIENPWAGQGFVEQLNEGIDEVAPQLGELLAPRIMEALGTPLEAYGKAAIVDRKSTRLNSSHVSISYAVFSL